MIKPTLNRRGIHLLITFAAALIAVAGAWLLGLKAPATSAKGTTSPEKAQEKALAAAVASQPTRPEAHAAYVEFLLTQRRGWDARDAATEAAERCPGEPKITSLLAEAQVASGRLMDAVETLREAKSTAPDLQLQLARYLLQNSNRQEALTLVHSLREPVEADRLTAGQLLLDAREPAAAVRMLEPLAAMPGDGRNYYGFALLSAGRYADAAKVLLEAAHSAQTVPTLHFYAGTALRLSGDVSRLPQAEKHLQQAVAQAPAEALFHYELALTRAQLRHWEGARAALEQAAKLATDSPEIQRDLARVYERHKQAVPAALARARYLRLLDDAAGAVRELEPRAQRDPANIELGLALSVALHEAGKFPQAAALVDRLQQREPQNPQVLWSQFRLRKALKQNDRALRTLDELEKQAGSDPVIAAERAEILQRLARYAEAEKILENLSQREPDNAERHYNLGVSLSLWSQRPDAQQAAEASYRKALEIRPAYAEAHQALGKLLLSSNRTQEAIVHFRQALDLSPGYPDALRSLGRAYLAAGDKTRSEDAFELFRQVEARQKERERKELPVRQLRDVHRSRTALYQFYLGTGDEKAAIRELEIVTHAFPEDREAHALLEGLYGHVRRFQRQFEEREWLRKNGVRTARAGR